MTDCGCGVVLGWELGTVPLSTGGGAVATALSVPVPITSGFTEGPGPTLLGGGLLGGGADEGDGLSELGAGDGEEGDGVLCSGAGADGGGALSGAVRGSATEGAGVLSWDGVGVLGLGEGSGVRLGGGSNGLRSDGVEDGASNGLDSVDGVDVVVGLLSEVVLVDGEDSDPWLDGVLLDDELGEDDVPWEEELVDGAVYPSDEEPVLSLDGLSDEVDEPESEEEPESEDELESEDALEFVAELDSVDDPSDEVEELESVDELESADEVESLPLSLLDESLPVSLPVSPPLLAALLAALRTR